MPNTREKLIDGDKAQAVLVNMAEHLMEAGNPEMAGAVGYAAEVIGKQPTVGRFHVTVLDCKKDCANCWKTKLVNAPNRWIPVTERLPEEHDSIWAKLYGTKSWQPGLFRKCSDTVIACVERKDGKRRSVAIYTIDGKWDWHKLRDETVTHWMPLPELPKET